MLGFKAPTTPRLASSTPSISIRSQSRTTTANFYGPKQDHITIPSSTNMDQISGKLNSMAGGGKESEKNEDQLDKGMLHLERFCIPC